MTAALSSFVRQSGENASIDLVIGGARCGGCLAKIETGLKALPDVREARMNLSTSRLHLSWDGHAGQADGFARQLERMGFTAGPYIPDDLEDRDSAHTRSLLLAMAVAAFGFMNVMMLSVAVWSGSGEMSAATKSLLHWLSAAIALPIALFSGRPFFKSAWTALKSRNTNMDVPISLAILLACGLSVWETWHEHPHTYFDAALMLIFLLLIGRFLDARLRARTGLAARQLASLQVRNAHCLGDDGNYVVVPATELVPGDVVMVASGDRLPADGVILSGTTQLDTALITGETALQSVKPGDAVYSGTINEGAPITIEIRKASEDSFLADIAAMVEAGQQVQARYVRLADRAARAYVPVVHTLALLTFLGWILFGGTPRTAIINAIAVLIITCPCALGLAVPAVQVVAVGRLFAKGVLIRSGDALERLSTVRHVVFDKTGTLTQGQVTADVSAIPEHTLGLVAALARQSIHPASKALHTFAGAADVADVEETAGRGILGQIDGHNVRLGQARFVDSNMQDEAGLWAKVDHTPAFRIEMHDPVRPEARSTVEALHDMGLRTSILSGDALQTVADIAQQVGIDHHRGRMRPEEKLTRISELQAEQTPVLMVGDGINDAPALAHADASAALASGTEISRSASDIVLQGDTLSGLPFAIEVARAAKKKVMQNFGFAIIYNMLAVPLAVTGHVTPLIAAIAMSGSSLIVILNALRMHRVGESYEGPDHPGRFFATPAAAP
ncbi:heavy metal translocating P-type ATPase [uncultured Algimonas sp.]|uniref:heavy metal translocating P-type ATPase n=1 Tax=uncultured Algimonas sp. TaxID=1547920 RepID=UPI00262EABCE|nr:heavy metal translocating P-type ATPase [uncultured Algimonas sp.]